MDLVRDLADASIRRALGFAGLGISVTMVALCFDAVLSLRTGALMTAAVWLGLFAAALRVPHRDVRRTELWSLLRGVGGPETERWLATPEARASVAAVLRERLDWHALRAAAAAALLWAVALAWMAARALTAPGD